MTSQFGGSSPYYSAKSGTAVVLSSEEFKNLLETAGFDIMESIPALKAAQHDSLMQLEELSKQQGVNKAWPIPPRPPFPFPPPSHHPPPPQHTFTSYPGRNGAGVNGSSGGWGRGFQGGWGGRGGSFGPGRGAFNGGRFAPY